MIKEKEFPFLLQYMMSFRLAFRVFVLFISLILCFCRHDQTGTWQCSITQLGQTTVWLIPSVWSCFIVTWSEPPLTLLGSIPWYTAGNNVGNSKKMKKLHTLLKGKRFLFYIEFEIIENNLYAVFIFICPVIIPILYNCTNYFKHSGTIQLYIYKFLRSLIRVLSYSVHKLNSFKL